MAQPMQQMKQEPHNHGANELKTTSLLQAGGDSIPRKSCKRASLFYLKRARLLPVFTGSTSIHPGAPWRGTLRAEAGAFKAALEMDTLRSSARRAMLTKESEKTQYGIGKRVHLSVSKQL